MCLPWPHIEEELGPRLDLKQMLRGRFQTPVCIHIRTRWRASFNKSFPGPKLRNPGSVGLGEGLLIFIFKKDLGLILMQMTHTPLPKRLYLESLMGDQTFPRLSGM